MRLSLVLCLVVLGCSADALPQSTGDGGGVDASALDLAPSADALVIMCEYLRLQMKDWTDSHQGCATDSDCAWVPFYCCPTIANTSTATMYYSSLLAQAAEMCAGVACGTCPSQGTPVCSAGRCAMKSPDACVGYVYFVEDSQTARQYSSSCQGSWGSGQSSVALGYRFSGGPPPGVEAMIIDACLDGNAQSPRLRLAVSNEMGPGTYSQGTSSYTDAMGAVWGMAGDPFKVTLASVNPVGGTITGTFSATVTRGGNAAHSLVGNFQVCRVMDELAP